MVRWWMALAGLFLSVFAVVALSGPGRIDIIDGRVRYEVARSLVDHGDVDIQDPRIRMHHPPWTRRPAVQPVPVPPIGCGRGRDPGLRRIRAGLRGPPGVLLLRSRARSRVRCWLPPMRYSSAAWASDRKPHCSGRLRGSSARPTGTTGPAPSTTSSARPRWSWPWQLPWGAGNVIPGPVRSPPAWRWAWRSTASSHWASSSCR